MPPERHRPVPCEADQVADEPPVADQYLKLDPATNQWLPVQPPGPQPQSPAARVQYSTQVNKGSISMGNLERMLNARAREGWRLAHIFEQDGNTVMVFERPV